MGLNPVSSTVALFGALTSHPILFAVLFVLLFGGLVALLAGPKAPSFLVGLLRAFASCFYSPVVWLRKAMLSTAEFAERSEGADTKSDQYLLNRILTILRAAAVVLVIGGLAAGLARSGVGLIPPKHLRERISELGKGLKERETQLRQAELAQADVEQRWATTGPEKVRAYRDDASARLDAAKKTMEQHARALQNERWFEDLKAELDAARPADGPARFDQAQTAARRRIAGLWFWDSALRQHAVGYVSIWRSAATAEYELRVVPEEEIRQALLAKLVETTNQAREEAEGIRGQLKMARAAAIAGIVRACLGALGSVLAFLGSLWLFGLLVEWVWLFIRLADNVGAIRERGL